MSRTLLLYDGKMSSAERIAQTLCCLIGNSNAAEISAAPQNFADYDGYCFVFNFYGAVTAGRTRAFLTGHREVLTEKRIAFVGIGFSDIGYAKYVSDTETAAGISGIAGYFISSENDTPRTGYEIGKMMRAPVNVMPEVKLERAVDDFIIEHNTLCLATADEGYVRCTPLEYIFLEHRLYIITEGGNKFRGILGNGQISAAIFDPYVSTEDVRGLQIMGNAELVADDSVEYFTVLEQKEITAASLAAMPVKLFVVRITPYSYEFTDSAFVRDGYDAKQIMETNFLRENWEAGALYAEHATAAEHKDVSGGEKKMTAATPAGAVTELQAPQKEADEDAADSSSEDGQTDAGSEKTAHAPSEGEEPETWQADSVTEPENDEKRPDEERKPEHSEEERASSGATASAPDEETDEDSDAFLAAAGDVARQASDAEDAIRKETAAAEDGSDLKETAAAEDGSDLEHETDRKTDTDGLPVLDMSVLDGLVPSAESSEDGETAASEYEEDDLSAKESLLSRISQKRSLDEEREERCERKKDRKKSGESMGSRFKSWLEDLDDDEDEDTEDDPEQENSEGRRTYSFYKKKDTAAHTERDGNAPAHAEASALSAEDSAEKTAVSSEKTAGEEAGGGTAASHADAEKRMEAKPAGRQPGEKNGSFLSRLGHTIGTFLSVDEEDILEDDEDDEDDFSLGTKKSDAAVKSSSERAERATAPEDAARAEEEKSDGEKKPEKKEPEKKKQEKKRSAFHGITSRRFAADDDDLDDDLDDELDDDDFGDEEDEEFEEEISRKSGPGVRDDEADLGSDDVDTRYVRMLDHEKGEKKHGKPALPSFLRNAGRKAEERIAADREKEKKREAADEKADSGVPQDGNDQDAEMTDGTSSEALSASEAASAEESALQAKDGEKEEHITADEEEIVDDADEADEDAEETGGGELVFDFSVDDGPYEDDQDPEVYPEEETFEDADIVPAAEDEDAEDADLAPAAEDEDAEDVDVTPPAEGEDAGNAYSGSDQGDDAAGDAESAVTGRSSAAAGAEGGSSENGSRYASHDMSELTGSHTHTCAPSDEPERTSAGPDIPEFMMKRQDSARRHAHAQDFRDDLAVHDSGEERREREAKNAAIDAAVREARSAGHTVDVSGNASGRRRKKKKHHR